ncbi:MAG: O-methyltransferase [Trueperaceae bacterium]|nr:MAG: O-methyltransferase [Trueperaceae bacterium]
MHDSIQQLSAYLTALVPERPLELQEMEAYAKEHRFPIIGPAAGQFCLQIARMVGAQRIFELGSGYGYSTAWFARAVRENGGGTVFHVVWDEDLSQKARGHLRVLGYDDLIEYRVAEAVEALRETEGSFDLVFNDIDKEGYPDSWPVIAEKVRPGGVVITDNMFFGGTVFDRGNREETTEGVREFTRLVSGDPDWISLIVPIRDGLMVSFKR